MVLEVDHSQYSEKLPNRSPKWLNSEGPWGKLTEYLDGSELTETRTSVQQHSPVAHLPSWKFSEMQLSLSQPCFWTLLMLTVLNLLLWERAASVPMHASLIDHDMMSLKDLLDHAVTLSYNITELTTEIQRIFLEDVQYTPGRWFPERELTGCHTSAVSVSIPKDGAQQIHGVFLLKETISLLEAWKYPLHHIATVLSHMEDAPNDIISRAKNIEAKTKELLADLKRILSKIQPGFPESYAYPTWNGLASLQSPDEETRFFALYNFLHCLTKDSRKVHSNLKLLQCQLLYQTDC
ncbi:prolactin-6A1-like [Cricetulus griseus]|uniref:Prolactin-6A1-like n=1 Tax=Cricetulus griseus TaxID=10029 RepID=A0A9J7GVC1_CRIGR|nr:prolactin-6A1-like [Cricetulus griseus]XP_035316622.1 prolactin-6A1-like [Cricetulus griseus]